MGEGSALVAAAPEAVWAIMLAPEHFRGIIPGCRTLSRIGENDYRGDIEMGVGVIKGLFAARVRLFDLNEPRSLRLQGSASGALGASRGEAAIRLEPEGEDTRVQYVYGADLTGKVAAVGGRMIKSAARIIIGDAFKRLARRAEPGTGRSIGSIIVAMIEWLRARLVRQP